jgi:transposase
MDLRQQRGMELAATRTIRRRDGWWWVPSQSGKRLYRVQLAKKFATCECADFKKRGANCKHIFAASYVRIRKSDGRVREPVMGTRTTYPQDWAAYNAAQINEKDEFQILLHELCSSLPDQPSNIGKRGRPAVPLSDAIFATTFKIYSRLSARRFQSDLREAHKRKLISCVPNFNIIYRTLGNDHTEGILRDLIVRSSLPLASIETRFAADSTGFSVSKFDRWVDHEHEKQQQPKHQWVKCHLACGVVSNIVTAVEIKEQSTGDSPLLPFLLKTTAQNFKIEEVYADKGYASKKNFEIVGSYGALPFIQFRSHDRGLGGGMWGKMYHLFQLKQDEFLAHYHQRSNVESTFAMTKMKIGDSVFSRTKTAMKNEVYCKVLCHNIVVVIHEAKELGIDPTFARKEAA